MIAQIPLWSRSGYNPPDRRKRYHPWHHRHDQNDHDTQWSRLRCCDDDPPEGAVSENIRSKRAKCAIQADGRVLRVSARDCSVILGLSPFIRRDELVLDKSGCQKKYIHFTPDIHRGIELEPVALESFAGEIGSAIDKLKCKEIRFPRFVLSGRPDGVFVDEDGRNIVVEVKCPKRNSRKTPVAYYIQLQVYIYLYGSPYGYYVEYIANRPLNVIRVDANPELMAAMWCHISRFVEDVAALT